MAQTQIRSDVTTVSIVRSVIKREYTISQTASAISRKTEKPIPFCRIIKTPRI
jgi:hypothetical protein